MSVITVEAKDDIVRVLEGKKKGLLTYRSSDLDVYFCGINNEHLWGVALHLVTLTCQQRHIPQTSMRLQKRGAK